MNDKKKQEVTKEDIAKDFVKTLGDLDEIREVEKMIKDNKIEFNVKDIKYRVRQLSFEEGQELEKRRRKKYLEFVKDDDMMFEKQWKKIYLKKGIDIDQMEQEIIEKDRIMNQLMIKLAQTSDKKRVEELKTEIRNLRGEQALLTIEKTDLMSHSIEDQLRVVVNSYYTYLVLEKLTEKEKWVRVYKSFEDFNESTDTMLINRAFRFVNHLIYSIGLGA